MIYLVVTQSMGRFTAFTNEASFVPSLFSKKKQTEFYVLKNLFDDLSQLKPLETLSMGMSGDYPLAIQNGSTMVRVGSKIFGGR